MRSISNEELLLISGGDGDDVQTVVISARRMTEEEKNAYDSDYDSAFDNCMKRNSAAGGAFFSFTTKSTSDICDLGLGNLEKYTNQICSTVYEQKSQLESNGGNGKITMCQIEAAAVASVPSKQRVYGTIK